MLFRKPLCIVQRCVIPVGDYELLAELAVWFPIRWLVQRYLQHGSSSRRSCCIATVSQHEAERGFVWNLLRVSAEASLELSLRQMAAIAFKRAVERRWEPSSKGARLIH